MLHITDLHARIVRDDNQTEADASADVLRGLSLEVPAGAVHAIMGPNGSGKSTLSYLVAGRPGYEVTGGAASLDGQDLLAMEPEERAAKGVFLSFQYPLEIPGVPVMTFARTALNAQHKARGEPEVSAPEFLKRARAAATLLKIDLDMLKRPLNVGFSGRKSASRYGRCSCLSRG